MVVIGVSAIVPRQRNNKAVINLCPSVELKAKKMNKRTEQMLNKEKGKSAQLSFCEDDILSQRFK